MKKTIAIILVVLTYVVTLTACDKKCKFSGCNETATNDGYCSYHSKLKAVDDTAKNIFNNFSK